MSRAIFQELLYLNGVLGMKRQMAPEKILELFNEAIETHFAGLKVWLTMGNFPHVNIPPS